MTKQTSEDSALAMARVVLFQEQAIRRLWHEDAWWFSVVDVCAVLTGSVDAGACWRKLKQRMVAEACQPVTFCHGLKLTAPDGKQRLTDCANTEGLFRIIQSIPSPKAEPFKRWLAQVGYARVQEIENPELASARARELYQAKGYPKEWIEKRLRSRAVRGELTDEWKARGVQEGKEYAILTADLARKHDARGLDLNRHAARQGGTVARVDCVAKRKRSGDYKSFLLAGLLLISGAANACFLSGEQTSGFNKICYHNCVGGIRAITIGATSLCPLSLSQGPSKTLFAKREFAPTCVKQCSAG